MKAPKPTKVVIVPRPPEKEDGQNAQEAPSTQTQAEEIQAEEIQAEPCQATPVTGHPASQESPKGK